MIRFANWVMPLEFVTTPIGSIMHRVASFEVGFLDILSVRYYGANNEILWWVIQEANAMIDPEQEMYPGQMIVIPPKASVQQFLSRVGNGQT
jgi:hypothetical protein